MPGQATSTNVCWSIQRSGVIAALQLRDTHLRRTAGYAVLYVQAPTVDWPLTGSISPASRGRALETIHAHEQHLRGVAQCHIPWTCGFFVHLRLHQRAGDGSLAGCRYQFQFASFDATE